MIFLSELYQNMEDRSKMKVGIDNLIGNITTRPDSHKGGWTRLTAAQLKSAGFDNVTILKDDQHWGNYDLILIDYGAEFDGAYNLFGGANDELAARFNMIKEAYENGTQMMNLRVKEPMFADFIKSRQKTCSDKFSELVPEDFSFIDSIYSVDHIVARPNILIGDSHTPGKWTPYYTICRQDGQTLFGLIRDDIVGRRLKEFTEVGYQEFPNVAIYAGNIDIRHHLARQSDPKLAAYNLACSFEAYARDLKKRFNIKTISTFHLLPIEDESRKLPKTGYYKGTPFYGDWELRNLLKDIFNDTLNEVCGEGIDYITVTPSCFTGPDGKLPFEVMERPQSVHISPRYYVTNLDTLLYNGALDGKYE